MASSSIQSSRPKPDLHFGSGVKDETRLAIVKGAFLASVKELFS